ncbi:AMP-binding enzyme family protein (macronuclear) [Tetrahymena thermophila SB210]|uniref:AMP-binding enzyme family protein n=1 Tax=Tetrahymena thermophila (strain SB210) TaxID=312017 RepID=Q23G32_TETTS|nr:AMP-binding enzyme family protein [Tetrahymena thermophila SB210]EAR95428.1 AMP-binding enzyme family protein [Tetrahymena thermophila SB210]|eukprot:XP_001015673.1 AMP-binding enzyme family protein [Tetrahymena thermophila SB210]
MRNCMFDLFSSHFFFKVNGKSIKQGTSLGSFVSFVIITLGISYLCYLLNQYFNNQIDPNYRAQNFTNNQSIDLDLSDDLISFRFEYDYNLSVDVLQAQTNKTYVVYMAYFIQLQQSGYQMIPINIVKCKNPKLLGYNCIDYSTISNSTLLQDSIENIQTQIQIFVYGCLDQDFQKTTIPNNCAQQSEINDVINGINAFFKLQIKTSQYNVKSKQFQTAYRSSQIFTLTSQYIQSTLKIQKQITTVKEGFFFQSELTQESPQQYDLEVQTLDRQSAIQLMNLQCYCQSGVIVDQLYQQVQIQYPTIPSILALANSVFSILMLLGFIGRRFSLKLIDKKFFMILFQNIFQQSYIQVLSLNNLLEKKMEKNQQNNLQNEQIQRKTDESEEINIQKENESAIDKSNSLSPPLYFKPMKLLNMRNSVNNKDEHNSSGKIDFQPSQKHISELNIPNILTFQDQKESLEETCNQSKEFLQTKNKFQEKLFQNERSFYSQNEQKINRIKVTSISLFEQRQKSNSKYLKTKKLIYEKKQFQEDFSKYNQIIKSLQSRKAQIELQKILNKSRILSRNSKETKSKNLNDIQKQNIQNLLDRELDIYQFYEDILFLKKAVMILLSQDQLAALKLVGCSSQFLELNLKELEESQLQLQKNLSHFEEQFAIQLSNELKIENIKKFLQKCQNKNNLSDIDLRIISSISSSLNL